MKRIAILGAGPAGVGAAFRLRREKKAEVVLVERQEFAGGNAASFDWNGHRLDYGSHRLHPSCAPAIMADIRAFLGDELLDRPRHGRIRLLGKWVHFPLKPGDLFLHLDKRFAFGTLFDLVRKLGPARNDGVENFASVLRRNLGRTICDHFYFPYARKIWGLAPEALSAIQARRRVSAGTFRKLFGKILRQVPGLKKKGGGRFFYPRGGFGAIATAYADAALAEGAELRFGTTVSGLELPRTEAEPWVIRAVSGGAAVEIRADHVWSTLPIPLVARLLSGEVPAEVAEAATSVDYRAMILVYLELPVAQFTPFDAHYFPGADIAITRLSEPKNYAVRTEPSLRTVLCAELPCARGDRYWSMSDPDLGRVVADDLARAGLPLPAAPVAVSARRLPEAYPLYVTGYERPLEILDRFAGSLPRFLSYGRQGLFAHDNTHHALAMAYAAVDCFDGERLDPDRWAAARAEFRHHVVED